MIFEVHFLREVGRAKVAFELLLARVLLHVPGHVLGGDALAADRTLGAHLGFGHRHQFWQGLSHSCSWLRYRWCDNLLWLL